MTREMSEAKAANLLDRELAFSAEDFAEAVYIAVESAKRVQEATCFHEKERIFIQVKTKYQ
ncbi:hypothetical protein [Methylosinus sp. R-45379]|uniref:hypothetical protein n=1 Tax=Methylosinus sp. R-45379 TaxID=980563 RepID=UPI0012EE49CD|nr:hypothetical protein [Methylosinus sp. R-45379]